ncbi:MAG TPA: MmgE/PrpD family protein [Pseudolabrys sp.]|nr:MmgE/PrpD family protein [Pseudolabrys sp.]
MPSDASTDPALNKLTMRLAEFAAGLTFAKLPAEVREQAKLIARDSLGNQIAASAISEAGIKIVQQATEWGGKPEATVIGFGAKLPSPMAALCNGTLGHGVELDDAHGSGLIKAGSLLVPSAFIAAELTHASGQDTLAALVAGYEIAVRIAKAINPGHRQRGYHTTSSVGTIGSAVIVAKMLGCDAETIACAIGLAAMHSAGLQAYLDDPCMAKPLGPGRAAFNGMLSGVMASRGFTGPKTALESREGFLRGVTDQVNSAEFGGLGERFVIMEVGFKPHSACRYAHGPLDIAQYFYREGVRIPEIANVDVHMSALAIRQASKPKSSNLNVAMGSTQFGVALALARGSNGLLDYWRGFEDKSVHAAAEKINLIADPAYGLGGRQSMITLSLKDGRVLTQSQEEPRGEPANPLSAAQLEAKFLATAGLVLADEQVAAISTRVMALEREPDAGAIPPLTVVPEAKPKLRAA